MTDLENSGHDDGLLAAELALGLLEGDAAREALRRQSEDAQFAAQVRKWQRIADGWLEGVEGVEPGPELLARIERNLDRPSAAGRHAPRPRVSPWRGWALTGMAAALLLSVALGATLMSRRQPAPAPAPIERSFAGNVTQISDPAGVPLLSAVYERGAGHLSLRVAALAKDSKVPELWVIPQGGAPQSLGLVASDKLTIEVSPQLRALLTDGATLAITLEDPSGAPHDAPTGKVIGAGKLQAI